MRVAFGSMGSVLIGEDREPRCGTWTGSALTLVSGLVSEAPGGF